MQVEANANGLGNLTAQSLAAKYRGKKEIYNLLTVDCGLYLPPFKTANVFFYKAIMCKQKKAIKTSAMRYIFAPQYPSLSIEKILTFASRYAAFEEYLPDQRDVHMLPRQWILNVAYTIIGDNFGQFIRSAVDTRNERLADRNDLNIAIDPEILAVIQNSSAVATQTGSSAHLLKVGSKRRRTRAEIEEYRSLQESQLEVIAARDNRIEQLELQLNRSKSKLVTAEKAEHLMGEMMNQGVLVQQEDGTYTIKQE